MPRYFFHVFDGVSAHDEEGTTFRDAAAARAFALHAIRDIMADQVRHGVLDLGDRIEIEGDAGEAIETIWFRDAIAITDRHRPVA